MFTRIVMVGLLAALLPAGAAAPTVAAGATVTVTAPGSIKQELTVWDVGLDSDRGRVNPATPAHVATISAEIVMTQAATNVWAVPSGPGTFTPTSTTRWASLASSARVTVSWRWTAPLRVEDAPETATVQVQVRNGNGVLASGSAVVATPPPPAPQYDSYVSDLPLDFAFNGYGPVERDRNNGDLNRGDGGPIALGGVTYPKGLGLNARGYVGVHLGARCTRFTALVGIDDAKGTGGSVIFRVVADGQVRFDSGVMTGATAAKPINVDVTGVRRLKLVVDPTADGQSNDWADWAGAHLVCGGLAPAGYRLINVNSRQCLDVKADSRDPGANIDQFTCNGGGNQRFQLTRAGDVSKLTGANSGHCVGVAGSVVTNGGNVIQWTCGTSTSQNWRPVSMGRGAYALRNGNSDLCMEVHQASTAAGANVQQWACGGGAHQSWFILP